MSPTTKTGAARALLLALSLSCLPVFATALPAFAKTIVFKQTGRDTPIELPDAWAVSSIRNGIEIRSDDEEVFIWIQATTDETIGRTIDEYFTYFRQQGVTFTARAEQQQDVIAGVPVRLMDLPATYEGKKTLVRFIISNAKAGAAKGVVIGYWASPAGDKKHDAAVTVLMGDLLRP